MLDVHWSHSEKQIARRVFESSLERELEGVIQEFKARVTAISSPADMWDLERFLSDKRREIDAKYDYRYSQLYSVFGRLLSEGRIDELSLQGLADAKLEIIRRIASL